MEYEDHQSMPDAINVDLQLTPVERTILGLLQNHTLLGKQIIDVPRLQTECLASGLSTQEFSSGFIRLLTRRLLEPRGDFTFGLSTDKIKPC